MNKSCETCRFWKKSPFEWNRNGECETIRLAVFVRSEDTNSYIETPPDFYCVKFLPKKKEV